MRHVCVQSEFVQSRVACMCERECGIETVKLCAKPFNTVSSFLFNLFIIPCFIEADVIKCRKMQIKILSDLNGNVYDFSDKYLPLCQSL